MSDADKVRPEPESYTVPARVFTALMNELARQPYAQVHNLLKAAERGSVPNYPRVSEPQPRPEPEPDMTEEPGPDDCCGEPETHTPDTEH